MFNRKRVPLWRSPGLLLSIFGSWVVILGVTLLFLGGVSLFGGVRSSGRFLDWTVVAALAGVSSALASAALVASLGLAVEQAALARGAAEQEWLREHYAHGPYLRVDIGFEGMSQPNFVPAPAGPILTAKDLQLPELSTWLAALSTGAPSGGLRLLLWVTNIAEDPHAIADSVQIQLAAVGTAPNLAGGARIDVSERQTIQLAYLVAGQTTTIELGVLDPTISGFLCEARDVRYLDRYGFESRDCHGSMILVYDNGEVTNDRKVRRGELVQNGRSS